VRRGERGAALAAETLILLIGGAAGATRPRKRDTALPAKLPAGSVLGAAVGTKHAAQERIPALRTGQACYANRLLER